MTIQHWFIKLAPSTLLVLAACSQATPEQTGHATQALTELPGFVHTPKQAFADLSKAHMEKLASGATRLETDNVQYVTHPNGWAISLAKTAFKLESPVFPGTLDDHNQAVRALFEAQGLPVDQMGPVGGTPYIYSEGSEEPTDPVSPDRVIGYASTVMRKLDGILVQSSVAVASLDEKGEPVAQNVYWPRLPRQVLDEAIALRSRLEDPHALADYTSKLGIDMAGRETKVVIYHSTGADRGPFEARAVVEVSALDDEVHGSRLFDKDGQRFLRLSERDVTEAPELGSWSERSSCAVTGDFRLPVDARGSINVSESGRWVYAREASRLEGELKRTAEGIAITDDERSSTTACKAGVQGRYKVLFKEGSCETLRFELIEDACEGRARTLNGLVLKSGALAPTVQLGGDGALQE